MLYWKVLREITIWEIFMICLQTLLTYLCLWLGEELKKFCPFALLKIIHIFYMGVYITQKCSLHHHKNCISKVYGVGPTSPAVICFVGDLITCKWCWFRLLDTEMGNTRVHECPLKTTWGSVSPLWVFQFLSSVGEQHFPKRHLDFLFLTSFFLLLVRFLNGFESTTNTSWSKHKHFFKGE